jgi:hypothetical protein
VVFEIYQNRKGSKNGKFELVFENKKIIRSKRHRMTKEKSHFSKVAFVI